MISYGTSDDETISIGLTSIVLCMRFEMCHTHMPVSYTHLTLPTILRV